MALPAGRYGVTKAQLLKIKKLPMNTIKLIEELIEKYNSLGTAATKNSTSVVTDSTDLVESGAVKDIVGWGNKNLGLHINKFLSGSDNDGFQILDGGSSLITKVEHNTQYTISRKHGVGPRFRIVLFKYEPSSTPSSDSLTVVFDNTLDTYTFNSGMYNYVVFTYNNTTVDISQDTAEAMIELGDTATSYEPYHASVEKTLTTKTDNSVIAPIENGTNASQAYAVGQHFIRDGAFCTCIQAIAQGGTFTLNTNYTAGDVADCLIKQATFSGTTSANGNLNIYDGLDRIILTAYITSQSAIAELFIGTNTQSVVLSARYIHALNATGQILTNTAVSGTYYYID